MLFSMASICLWKLGTSTCSRVSILSSASANSWKHFSTRMPSCKVQHDIDLEFCTAKPVRAGYMGAALARYCCKTCRSKDWAPQERKYCQVGQSNLTCCCKSYRQQCICLLWQLLKEGCVYGILQHASDRCIRDPCQLCMLASTCGILQHACDRCIRDICQLCMLASDTCSAQTLELGCCKSVSLCSTRY